MRPKLINILRVYLWIDFSNAETPFSNRNGTIAALVQTMLDFYFLVALGTNCHLFRRNHAPMTIGCGLLLRNHCIADSRTFMNLPKDADNSMFILNGTKKQRQINKKQIYDLFVLTVMPFASCHVKGD